MPGKGSKRKLKLQEQETIEKSENKNQQPNKTTPAPLKLSKTSKLILIIIVLLQLVSQIVENGIIKGAYMAAIGVGIIIAISYPIGFVIVKIRKQDGTQSNIMNTGIVAMAFFYFFLSIFLLIIVFKQIMGN